jgi:DTW domain-containing protein YfiP
MTRAMSETTEPAGRPTCARCRRPTKVCYCAHVEPLETTTRVVILQHPRERDMAIGTAHMASLCLPGSELYVGVDWAASPELARAISDPERPAYLLYPGEGARDVFADPPKGPVTLVVVDGTWWQARKLVRTNPVLAALPRVAFAAPEPSEYRIRKEPDEAYVSTIEALAYVLGALEGDPARFEALRRPFRAMVDAQIAFREGENHGRHGRFRKKPRTPQPRVPLFVGEREADLVAVVAEANAWPIGLRERLPECPDELVQLVAVRVATGEVFDTIAAPRGALSSTTPSHVEIPADALLAGGSLEALHDAWRAFVRPRDVLVGWGPYGLGLLGRSGCVVPGLRLDARVLVRDLERTRMGSLVETVGALGVDPGAPLARGRGGRRLAELAAVTRHLAAVSRAEAARLAAARADPP